MKGIRKHTLLSLWIGSLILTSSALSTALQEQSTSQATPQVKTKQHKIPKSGHSKSKTFTDDWENSQGGTAPKHKTPPDHWVGQGGGKSKGSHSDDWITTDASSAKPDSKSKNVHHKPLMRAQPKNPK